MNINSINFASRTTQAYKGERPDLNKKQDSEKQEVTLSSNVVYPQGYLDTFSANKVNIHWSDDDNLDEKILAPYDKMIQRAVDEGVENIAQRAKRKPDLTHVAKKDLIEDIIKGEQAEVENRNLVNKILENATTIGMGQAAKEELEKRKLENPESFDMSLDSSFDTEDGIDDIFEE